VSLQVLLAGSLAALALLLGWRDPHARLRRLTPGPATEPAASVGPLAGLLRGRSGSPPLRRRAGLGAVAATALCLALAQTAGTSGAWPWLCWPVLLAGVVLALGWLEPSAARSRHQRLVLETPQALELLAACLAVGTPPRHACAAVVASFDGPVAEDLHQVLAAVELGVPDAQAWLSLAGHRQLGPAAVDLARSVESGTRMVTALQAHAETARERRRAALQQAARGVGVRSVLPMMTCFIPAFLLLGVVPTVVSAVVQAFR